MVFERPSQQASIGRKYRWRVIKSYYFDNGVRISSSFEHKTWNDIRKKYARC